VIALPVSDNLDACHLTPFQEKPGHPGSHRDLEVGSVPCARSEESFIGATARAPTSRALTTSSYPVSALKCHVNDTSNYICRSRRQNATLESNMKISHTRFIFCCFILNMILNFKSVSLWKEVLGVISDVFFLKMIQSV
jgi:hypothetical protein